MITEKLAQRKLNRSTLRRFIRGRAYTTIAQIRRHFGLNGEDVTAIEGLNSAGFVTLSGKEAGILRQLWREGRIGLHFSLLVRAPVIEGVYPLEAPLRLV